MLKFMFLKINYLTLDINKAINLLKLIFEINEKRWH
jgi:hypothetical protein